MFYTPAVYSARVTPMSEKALRGVLGELYPHDTALGGRALANPPRPRDRHGHFRDGDTVGNAPGSKWCAWNAIVEHHDRRRRTPEAQWRLRRRPAPGQLRPRRAA